MANHHVSAGVSGWTSWVTFAAFLMMLSGVFQAINGLVAIFKQGVYVATPNQIIVLDYRQWGWTHLILGIVLLASSFSLFGGKMWGRILAIALASLSAVANFVFLGAYPAWSLLIITLDVLIIYSVAVHGRELREED
jgi:hypothetical protein